MFAAMKPPAKKKEVYNYYCGSCGCKYHAKPGSSRPACDSSCAACGSSRIIRYEWAKD